MWFWIECNRDGTARHAASSVCAAHSHWELQTKKHTQYKVLKTVEQWHSAHPPDTFSYGAQLGNISLSPACKVSQKLFHFIFPNNFAHYSI